MLNSEHIPPPLKPGDIIGISAPGGPFNREKFNRGITALRDMGFQLQIPDGIYAEKGYLAGPDQNRADILMDFFTNPEVRAVICARGGYGTLRILPLLDFNTIRANPKWLVGFSDISALLNVLPAQCGFCCLHGPVVTTLARADEKTIISLHEALCNGLPSVIETSNPVTIRPGKAEGHLMGGNLATLCHLTGTPWQPDLKGKILLLEDIGEPPYRIDRMLTHMKLAGCFDSLTGIMLGEFGDHVSGDTLAQIFSDLFKDRDIPILSGFDIGHGKTNLTIPVGLNAVLDTGPQCLSFNPYSES